MIKVQSLIKFSPCKDNHTVFNPLQTIQVCVLITIQPDGANMAKVLTKLVSVKVSGKRKCNRKIVLFQICYTLILKWKGQGKFRT